MLQAAIEHSNFIDLFTSRIFWCVLGGWTVASVIKMLIASVKARKLNLNYLFTTGGMPSCHSSTVTSLAFSVGYTTGFDSGATAVAIGLALVTMFDAATVRKAAGEHAKVLNAIVHDLKELKFKPARRLKELLGHTRLEVLFGMVTGIAWSTFVCWYWD